MLGHPIYRYAVILRKQNDLSSTHSLKNMFFGFLVPQCNRIELQCQDLSSTFHTILLVVLTTIVSLTIESTFTF
ncbi:hypothetical protein AMTRI_Chr12g272960 [Amborella trichopoda]